MPSEFDLAAAAVAADPFPQVETFLVENESLFSPTVDLTVDSGERVTFTGKECLCQKCVKSREATSSPDGNRGPRQQHANGNNGLNRDANVIAKPSRPQQVQPSANGGGALEDRCAGCAEDLKDGQALMALDKQYHVWCFKCHSCQVTVVLH